MKTKTTHTPGPWNSNQGRNAYGDYLDYVFKDGKLVATVNLAEGDTAFQRGTTEANARLIAAAPELLKIVESCLKLPTQSGGEALTACAKLRQQARTALEKVS